MSQYTHWFIRQGNNFTELTCRSRSSAYSEMVEEYAPWEHIRKLSSEDMLNILTEWRAERQKFAQLNVERKASITTIGTFNNSVEEKLDAINSLQESINDTEELLQEMDEAINVLQFLYDSDLDIYVGIECGYEVTVNDIIGEDK